MLTKYRISHLTTPWVLYGLLALVKLWWGQGSWYRSCLPLQSGVLVIQVEDHRTGDNCVATYSQRTRCDVRFLWFCETRPVWRGTMRHTLNPDIAFSSSQVSYVHLWPEIRYDSGSVKYRHRRVYQKSWKLSVRCIVGEKYWTYWCKVHICRTIKRSERCSAIVVMNWVGIG